ncbi:MAG: CoA transferase [Rhodospirillales bacterium]|nr:CoA transferase [Rhodospirillales bacterium]
MPEALAGIRVLECGDLWAASYCARLFADLGGDVTKIVPEHYAPANEVFDRAAWSFLNFGKRRALAAADPCGMQGFDLCIAGSLDSHALATLERARPAPIVIDMTWFGRSGPYGVFHGSDLVCRALAGLVQPAGPAEGPPVALPDFQAAIIGGLAAFSAALAALHAQAKEERSRLLEVSVHEAAIALAELQTADSWMQGMRQPRIGRNRFVPTYPLGIYPTADGWIGITLVTPVQWSVFCMLLGLDDLATDPTLVTGAERLAQAARLEARFLPRLVEKPAAHWFAEGRARRLPIVVVPTLADLLADPALAARGAIVPIDANGASMRAPGSPLRLLGTPPHRGGNVPEITSAKRDTRIPSSTPSTHSASSLARRDTRMLSDITIIDLSMGWAGPLASRMLADLGAEVIKVEACRYPDWWRGIDHRPAVFAERLYEKTGRFNALNRNKCGITLDLTTPEGVAALKDLVAKADAVVENYAADVLPKLGLGYDALREANPSLVMLSMCAFGASSAWHDLRAYGSTLEQASGLPMLLGASGEPPTMNHIAYGDAIGGLNGACALLAALRHRAVTGEGQWIDLAQVECLLPHLAPWLIAASTGVDVPCTANRHPVHAPQALVRCAGEDAWLAVSVLDTPMWRACAGVIGRPDLMSLDLHERRAREEELEAAITAWSTTQKSDAAMRELQRAGVAAGVALAPFDLFDDPHLVGRGFWQWVERAWIGRFPQASAPIREHGAPLPVRMPAPTLGADTAAVLAGKLGYDDIYLAALAAREVIGTEALPLRPRMRRENAP